jgi:hypothetical protein
MDTSALHTRRWSPRTPNRISSVAELGSARASGWRVSSVSSGNVLTGYFLSV